MDIKKSELRQLVRECLTRINEGDEYVSSAAYNNAEEIVEKMRNELGDTQLLDALLRAMSIDRKLDYLAYIDRCYELGIFSQYPLDDEGY